MARTYTALEIAISAVSGGGTSRTDIVDLVSSHRADLADADDAPFYAFCDEVERLIPEAPYCEVQAMRWARADAYCRAEDAAERRALSLGR